MMSQAEGSSRLATNLSDSSSSSGSLQETVAALATGACSDLARWALERNCLLVAPIAASINESQSGNHNKDDNLIHREHHHQFQQQQQQQSSNLYYGDLAINVTTATGANQGATSTLGSFHHNDTLADFSSSPLSQLVAGHLLEPMHQLESKLDYYTSDIWLSSGDERTNRLPFIGVGPWKLVYATIIYWYLIKWLLPRIMKPLKPLELNWPIRFYNLFMVVSNMWAFYHGARILHFGIKCFGCETINHHDRSPQAIELLHYGWLFFMSRIVEWLDTIFFVLRKKERQVTKLHVFHHSFVPLLSWTYIKYHPGYSVAFFPLVNSFVHSIMYTYYFLATFGPKLQPYLWWKRYLTSLQIAQFVLILIQLASIPLTGDETCQYPRGFLYAAFAGAILFLWLFYTYYLETYTKGRQRINSSEANPKGKSSGESFRELLSAIPAGSKSCVSSSPREGSSRSISEFVDNAIDSERSSESGDDNLIKLKSN